MQKKVWSFKTDRFEVALYIEPSIYESWGDDEVDQKIAEGEYVCFDSEVRVTMDEECYGSDYLGQSVYEAGRVNEFWTGHRDPDPMNRNCEAMKAARGQNASVCHYFPSMVREAVREARIALSNMPRVRAA